MIAKILDFTKHGIWRIPLKEVSRTKCFFIRQLRVVLVALRGFDDDKCMLWASALTFYSLLSIVPVVAMLFGVAKGFGFEERVKTELLTKFEAHKKVIEEVVEYAQELLNNTSGGLVAGIGVALLFWAIIKILGSVEKSFNHIWGVQQTRPWGRKFSDYLSLMLISPVLLIMSSSLTVYVRTMVTSASEEGGALGVVAGPILFLLRLAPYALVWLLFTFIYFWMPNTKVKWNSCIVAGVVGGTLFQLTQWFYITFQVGVTRYGAIYGSFAAWPLFLVWMQISWLIVLLGAEISFAHQNVGTYEFEQDSRKVSHSFRRLLALAIVEQIVKQFSRGERPHDVTALAQEMDIPIRLVRQIVFELVEAKVLYEVRMDGDEQVYYQPARDADGLTIKYVVDALDQRGSSDIPVNETDELSRLRECMATFGGVIENSDANLRLKDI